MNYDLQRWEKWQHEIAKIKGFKLPYNGAVAAETAKVEIKTDFKTRPFTYSDGVVGEVADKLIIEIDFKNVNLQPDQDFESHFSESCAETIAGHVEGLWDNSHDD